MDVDARLSRFDISRWTWANARWRPEQTALVEGDGRTLTYRQLEQRVDRLARSLSRLGVCAGDRVALLLATSHEAVELVLATARLGAIAVPLNFRLAPPELAFMLRDSGSRLLFWDREFSALAGALEKAGPLPVERWIAIGPPYEALLAGKAGVAAAAPAAGEAAAAAPEAPAAGEAAAAPDSEAAPETTAAATARPPIEEGTAHLIMYTAGTTGLPKGVVLTHGSTFWQAMNAVALGLLPGMVGLCALPLFHVGGLNGSVLPMLYIGGTVVLQRRFDPGETLSLIERHWVQGMVGVPAMFQLLAAHPRFAAADLSSLLVLTSGGAPLPRHTIELYRQRGILFRQGYGLTEAAPGVTGMDPQDCFRKAGSVGKPVHFVEVRIVDEEGRELPAGSRGELLVRGPNLMAGYHHRPEETARALRDGWLHTGDAAWLDEEGYVYVSGRLKEMIISGGENIYPAEIENALVEHEAVAEAAVIGAPDERWGQRPVAFVALRPGRTLIAEELLAFLEGRLARFKQPREVHFLPFLPRSAAGKVLQEKLQLMLDGVC